MEPHLAIDEVLHPLTLVLQGTSFYEHGMNVISWPTEVALLYFAPIECIPVSFPLIGLAQFTQ